MRKPSRLPSFAAAAVGMALAAGAALFGAPAAFAQNYGLGGIECPSNQRILTYGTGTGSTYYNYYDHVVYTNSGIKVNYGDFYGSAGNVTLWTYLYYENGSPIRGSQATYVNTSFSINGSFQTCV